MTSNVPTKGIALGGVICLVFVAAILSIVPPAEGYEISIYAAYPWYFWLFVIGATVAGQLLIVQYAVSDMADTLGLRMGVSLVFVSFLSLAVIPYVRGYPMYGRGDVPTHVGYVRDLAGLGIEGNIYPPMHLQIQSLATATGLTPETVITGLPVVFSIVFVGSMYYLVIELFEDRRLALFSVPFALFPVLGSAHVTVVPYIASILLAPLVLYLLFKAQRSHATSIRALLPIAIIGVVLYHPLVAVFAIVTFVVYVITKRVTARGSGLAMPGGRPSVPTTVFSLTLVVFSARYLSSAGIIIRFQNVLTALLMPEAGESELEATVSTIERTSPEPIDLFRIAAVQYGTEALVFGFATLFFAWTLLQWRRHGRLSNRFVVFVGSIVVSFAAIATLFLLFDFIGGFGRPLGFGTIFAAVLAGAGWYVLWRSSSTPGGRTVLGVALALTLVIVVSLSVFGLFHSPIIFEYNHQVTEMEKDGMEWLFDHRNDELLIEERGIRQYRFAHMQYGTAASIPSIRRADTRPPDRFNYTTRETLGESYESDRYLVITRLGRITYEARFPEYRDQWRYLPADYDRLERDRSVTRVYDNGEFDLYRVTATGIDPDLDPDPQPTG